MIMRARLRGKLLFGLLAVPVILALAGCGGGSTAESSPIPSAATPAASMTGSPMPSQSPAGPAPSPATIDASQLTIIDEWREAQVPQYPGAERHDFQPEPMSQAKNAGRMLYSTTDSPDQVIAFYRSALPLLGWKETTANERRMAAKHGNASLEISVSPGDGNTRVLLQLLDAPI